MKEPIFKTYCDQNGCHNFKWKMRQLGDGYKQICPVCGYIWNPIEGMTSQEINQYEMGLDKK